VDTVSLGSSIPGPGAGRQTAIRWVQNAQQYGFNPDQIAAWGGSAGGYLSTMLGTSAGIPELEDLSLGNPEQPCNVQAVVAWFGPTNFLKMDEQLAASGLLPPPGFRHSEPDSPESLLLGQTITEIPARVQAANPETYIRPGGPCFLLQHGTKDWSCRSAVHRVRREIKALGDDRVMWSCWKGPNMRTCVRNPQNVTRVLDF
jgi:acetyl esterase/lipase